MKHSRNFRHDYIKRGEEVYSHVPILTPTDIMELWVAIETEWVNLCLGVTCEIDLLHFIGLKRSYTLPGSYPMICDT